MLYSEEERYIRYRNLPIAFEFPGLSISKYNKKCLLYPLMIKFSYQLLKATFINVENSTETALFVFI